MTEIANAKIKWKSVTRTMRNDDKSGKEIEDEISVREETDWIWGKRGGGDHHRKIKKTSKGVKDMILRLLHSQVSFYSFFFCVADDVIYSIRDNRRLKLNATN